MVDTPKTLTPRQFVLTRYPHAWCVPSVAVFSVLIAHPNGRVATIGMGISRQRAWADAAHLVKKGAV